MSKRPLNNRRMLHNQLALMTLRLAAVCLHSALAMQWDHSVHLSPEYRMMWNVKHDEVTFEVQVRTLGYVGLGFSRDGSRSGADLAIGWIDRGQTYFQVSIRQESLLLIIVYAVANLFSQIIAQAEQLRFQINLPRTMM